MIDKFAERKALLDDMRPVLDRIDSATRALNAGGDTANERLRAVEDFLAAHARIDFAPNPPILVQGMALATKRFGDHYRLAVAGQAVLSLNRAVRLETVVALPRFLEALAAELEKRVG